MSLEVKTVVTQETESDVQFGQFWVFIVSNNSDNPDNPDYPSRSTKEAVISANVGGEQQNKGKDGVVTLLRVKSAKPPLPTEEWEKGSDEKNSIKLEKEIFTPTQPAPEEIKGHVLIFAGEILGEMINLDQL